MDRGPCDLLTGYTTAEAVHALGVLRCANDAVSRHRRHATRRSTFVSQADVERQLTLPDEAWQLAVLSRVLVLHPERLSGAELRREMLAGKQEFARIDAHDRAVRDLVAAGLLREDDDGVVATRAATQFAFLHG